MVARTLAHGLASLGRGNDSMLMHVTPREVAGLKAIAHAMGGEITTNPHTGLPEAGFFDFFTSLLPTAAGILLAPETGGTSLGLTGLAADAAPIIGGMATGAAVAAAKGNDPLMGGALGALGGYGGGNLGNAFANMGGAVPASANLPVTASNVMQPTGITNIGSGVQLGQFKDVIPTDQLSTAWGQTGDLTSNLPSTDLTAGYPSVSPTGATGGLDTLATGASKFASNPIAQWDAFKAAGGTGMQIGAPLTMAALEAATPDPVDMTEEEKKQKELANKYRSTDPNYILNLSADSGLRLAAGGMVPGAANYSGAQAYQADGGNTGLAYSKPDGTAAQNAPSEQYGLGRLEALANQGANTKASNEFYAKGGSVASQELGIMMGPPSARVSGISSLAPTGNGQLNLNNLPSLNLNTGTLQDLNATSTAGGELTPQEKYWLAMNGIVKGAGASPEEMAAFKDLMQQSYLKRGFATGGYLDGHGDGMSDSIPATIEGKQPARLADGEFVVPADVVSHLGNGSSKAGSKRLYAMLHKVRQARTGNPSQGKQINPNKYLPA